MGECLDAVEPFGLDRNDKMLDRNGRGRKVVFTAEEVFGKVRYHFFGNTCSSTNYFIMSQGIQKHRVNNDDS